MEQDARLPQSKGEGVLFGIIICFLTALFMSIFNSCISQGAITGDIVLHALMFFPLFMVIAFFVQNLIVGKIANILTTKFVKNSDSFNSRILFTTLFNVIFMSLIMTFIGIVVMTGFSSSLLSNFLTAWPRNFYVVLWRAFTVRGLLLCGFHLHTINILECFPWHIPSGRVAVYIHRLA